LLLTTSKDVGLAKDQLQSTLAEDGTVSESIEEDTDLHTNSVTESQVLPPISSEVKDTTVDVEIPRLFSPREIEDIMEFIQDTGTVKLQLLLTTSKDVGEVEELSLFILTEDGIVSELTEEDTELHIVSVTESMVLIPP